MSVRKRREKKMLKIMAEQEKLKKDSLDKTGTTDNLKMSSNQLKFDTNSFDDGDSDQK